MKTAAGELALGGLRLMQHRPFDPARTNDTIRLAHVLHQVMERFRRCRPICIHIPYEIGQRGQLQPLDQRAAFADGRREIDRRDEGEILGHAIHHPHRIIATAIQDHYQLETTGIIGREVRAVFPQNGLDPAFFVVGRNKQ